MPQYYGFETNQIVLAFVVWLFATLSAMARSAITTTDRSFRSRNKYPKVRVALACRAGFMAMGYLGAIALVYGDSYIADHRYGIALFSAFVGALSPEQEAIFMNTILATATKVIKKDDDK